MLPAATTGDSVVHRSEPLADRLDVLEAVEQRKTTASATAAGSTRSSAASRSYALTATTSSEPAARAASTASGARPSCRRVDERQPVRPDRLDRALGADAERSRPRREHPADAAEARERRRRTRAFTAAIVTAHAARGRRPVSALCGDVVLGGERHGAERVLEGAQTRSVGREQDHVALLDGPKPRAAEQTSRAPGGEQDSILVELAPADCEPGQRVPWVVLEDDDEPARADDAPQLR